MRIFWILNQYLLNQCDNPSLISGLFSWSRKTKTEENFLSIPRSNWYLRKESQWFLPEIFFPVIKHLKSMSSASFVFRNYEYVSCQHFLLLLWISFSFFPFFSLPSSASSLRICKIETERKKPASEWNFSSFSSKKVESSSWLLFP